MRQSRGGFVKTVLLIIIALVVLGFFGYNLRDIINSPDVRENFGYAWELLVKIWNVVIVTPALWMWDKILGLLSRS